MARAREFNPNTVLRKIEDVFWEKGYQGTSYADLMHVSGLGKGSLYSAFGNKKALYQKTLEAYINREVAGLGAMIVGTYEQNPREWRHCLTLFLDSAIIAVAERQDRRGCFLCNAATDLAPFDKDIEDLVLKGLGQVKKALAILLKHSEKKPTDALVEHFMAVYIGMRVMAKAGATPDALGLARDAALQSL